MKSCKRVMAPIIGNVKLYREKRPETGTFGLAKSHNCLPARRPSELEDYLTISFSKRSPAPRKGNNDLCTALDFHS